MNKNIIKNFIQNFKIKILYKPNSVERVYRVLFKSVNRFYLSKLTKTKSIHVVFFVHDIRQWHLNDVYLELNRSLNYTPLVIVVPHKRISNRLVYEYFLNKDYNVLDYKSDFKKVKFILKHSRIQFYSTPFTWFYPLRIQPYFNYNAMSVYVPYQVSIKDNFEEQFNNIFFRYIYIYFAESYYSYLKLLEKNIPNLNVYLSGHPAIDRMRNKIINTQKSKKKVILWTPHHSINQEGFSSFLIFKDYFINLADSCSEFYIIFRPHPELRNRLLNVMSVKEVDDCYDIWQTLECGEYDDGDYIESVNRSDIIVNDSLSFALIFQFTNKPMILTMRNLENHDIIPHIKTSLSALYHTLKPSKLNEILNYISTNRNSHKSNMNSFYPNKSSLKIKNYFDFKFKKL